MIKATLTAQRLVALFLFGCMAINYPILAIFDMQASLVGIPVLYLYVFGIWAALIALMAWIIER
ncbi:MAG: hypothetical protein JSS57_22840 [Proteobacteria bacterium]|nr:hypothetical protein [Pseudomonadota bacterium]RTL28234.1 MAG: hypothetical protein EKK49_16115 [Rhodocyclaceae bacterium]